MELEAIKSDLQALRNLYGLLHSIGNGSQSASSEHLDEKARIFLKNLLDGATERVFDVHSKLLAAQLGAFDATRTTQWNKLQGMPTPKPPLSLNVPKTVRGVAQCSTKAPNSNPLTLRENERTPIKPKPQVIVSERSKFSSPAIESENRKRRCNVCQQSRVKQIQSTGERSHGDIQNPNMGTVNIQHQQPNQGNCFNWAEGLGLDMQGTEQQKVIYKTQPKLGGAVSLAYPSVVLRSGVAKSGAHDFSREIEKKPDETANISEEVADAIRQVESCISSLQLAAEHVGPSEANSIPGIVPVSPTMQKRQGLVTCSELSQARNFVIGRENSLGKQASQRVWESKKLGLPPQVISQKQKMDSVGHDFLSQMASHNTSKPRERKLPDPVANHTSKLLPPNNGPLSLLVSEKVGKITRTALLKNFPGHVGKPVPNGHGKPSRRTVQVTGRNVKAIAEKIETRNRLSKQNDHASSHTLQHVQGLRVPPSQTNMANVVSNLPWTKPSQMDKENQIQNLMPQKELIRKAGTSQPSKQAPSLRSKEFTDRKTHVANAGYKVSGIQRVKGQLKISPTLYGSLIDQDRGRAEENNKLEAQQKKILPRQHESEDTSSCSSWTSQQASTCGSYSEEYSMSSHTRGNCDRGPISTSDNEGYSSGQTGDSYVNPRSSSESEVDPLPSRYRRHHVSSISDSESKDYSSLNRGSSSNSAGSSKDSRSGKRVKPKKKIGRLRQLKDKLALIFHYHHHHHHHHHHDDDAKREDQKTKAGRGTSLWKYAGKVFHGTSKDEAYGERAAEKLTKSVVCKVQDKNQHGHFHTLVKGLLGHVRTSKKSKPSKGSIKRLGGKQHGGKKAAKKLQWWKMFQRQKAVKLSSTPRVKLGIGNKKSRLQSSSKMT